MSDAVIEALRDADRAMLVLRRRQERAAYYREACATTVPKDKADEHRETLRELGIEVTQ
ncbi:hypothetical protein [Gordonia terrae]|uniref:hypothetical protein n=1 Tax=Gordonia terrae TaxID=2055 RepID=UPI003F6C27C8